MIVPAVSTVDSMPDMASKSDVFISYASSDRGRAIQLKEQLESVGVTVWIDIARIDGAAIWPSEIVDAIENCRVLILLCSDASMCSWAVTQEIQLAGEGRKPILPLVLERTVFPAQLRFFLAGRQWIEVGDSDESWLPKLFRALRSTGVRIPLATPDADQGDQFEAAQFDWSWDGLWEMASYTDRIWPFPAEDTVLSDSVDRVRGLGSGQPEASHQFRIGDRIRIAIRSGHDGHLLLLDEGPEGKTYCLCPSEFARDTRIRPGANIYPQEHARHHSFLITGRPGREQLLAIISTEPFEFGWAPREPGQLAHVLDDGDVEALLAKLKDPQGVRWTALSTYFEIVDD